MILMTSLRHRCLAYKNADDYWTKCSSSRVLKGIRVPVLAMNALNDPIVGKKSLPMESEVSKQVTLEYTQDGGHCGYPLGPFPEASAICRNAPEILYLFFTN